MKASEVLRAVAEILEPADAWGQGGFWRDADGTVCWVKPESIKCRCLAGGIAEASGLSRFGDDSHFDALNFVERVIGCASVPIWNDDPARTQPQVVAALRKAADLAESEGM
jgi:hypothetical protein